MGIDLVHARARRRFSRGLKKKGMSLVKKLRKAKKDTGPYDKPDVVKTHLLNMLIMPEMIGSVVGVHNGKVFTSVEVKADMVGHYLGEFSISYKPVLTVGPVLVLPRLPSSSRSSKLLLASVRMRVLLARICGSALPEPSQCGAGPA